MRSLDTVIDLDSVQSLDPAQSIGKALADLGQGISFGIVLVPDGSVIPMSIRTLQQAPDPTQPLGAMTAELPRLFPVPLDTSLARLTLLFAPILIAQPSLESVPVADAHGTIAGVVSRAKLIRTAQELSVRALDVGALAGEATSAIGMRFVCRADGEQTWVLYYQPSRPPRCRNGHEMIPSR